MAALEQVSVSKSAIEGGNSRARVRGARCPCDPSTRTSSGTGIREGVRSGELVVLCALAMFPRAGEGRREPTCTRTCEVKTIIFKGDALLASAFGCCIRLSFDQSAKSCSRGRVRLLAIAWHCIRAREFVRVRVVWLTVVTAVVAEAGSCNVFMFFFPVEGRPLRVL